MARKCIGYRWVSLGKMEKINFAFDYGAFPVSGLIVTQEAFNQHFMSLCTTSISLILIYSIKDKVEGSPMLISGKRNYGAQKCKFFWIAWTTTLLQTWVEAAWWTTWLRRLPPRVETPPWTDLTWSTSAQTSSKRPFHPCLRSQSRHPCSRSRQWGRPAKSTAKVWTAHNSPTHVILYLWQ